MVSHSRDNLNGRAMGYRRPGSGVRLRWAESEASDTSDLRSQHRRRRDGLPPKINPTTIGFASN
jgi:hypothetical protein